MIRFTSCAAILLFVVSSQCFAMISVGTLSKEQAREYGITMHHRKNGDAGVKVWLEFKKVGFLDKFSYCELRMNDLKGKHLVSAKLQPHPVTHGQSDEIISVAFSASPAQLENCAFMIVAYGSINGDVGYLLNVKDFLNKKKTSKVDVPIHEHKSSRVGENFKQEIADAKPPTIDELKKLPVGIEVTHTPNPARASLTEQGKRRGKYTWWYKTQVQAKESGVRIEQFGSFVWLKGQWKFANYTRKPFATKDFSEWYSCPDGLLTPGKMFEDPTNWGSSNELSANKAWWYFIGVDEEGRRVKGEAVINGLGELVKE